MLKKTDIINAVNEMEGEDVDLQLLQGELFLLQKIAQGEADVKDGRIYSTKQLKEHINTWRQSPGQKLPKRPDCHSKFYQQSVNNASGFGH